MAPRVAAAVMNWLAHELYTRRAHELAPDTDKESEAG